MVERKREKEKADTFKEEEAKTRENAGKPCERKERVGAVGTRAYPTGTVGKR